METDSLIIKKVLDRIWEIPWGITVDTRCIMEELKDKEVVVTHIFREGNKMANFLTNYVFSFAGTNNIQLTSVEDLPGQAQAILHGDKQGTPNLRIKKCQNANSISKTKPLKQRRGMNKNIQQQRVYQAYNNIYTIAEHFELDQLCLKLV